jgi:DNA-binding CsgD family transcriptional regulator
LSHPVIIFMFFLYTCIMPAREAWSYFMLFGLVYGFFSVAILFSITGINMVRFGSRESALFHKYFRYEGAARLILISGIFLAISLSLLKVIKGWEFMTMNIFLIIYLMVSISFLTHRRIRLPLKTIDSMPLFVILQKEFSFTYKESSIACLVHEGYTRNDICSRLDITNETIKKHLKSIYKKSIEKNPGFDVSGRDKFQKLTLFLSRIR